MEIKFVDSHAHLDDKQFDKDREEVIKELKAKGIELVLNPGADKDSSIRAVDLSKKYDFIYAAVGTHPHDAKKMSNDIINLYENLAKEEKVLAIGEIGLDYFYENSDREVQKKWFKEQIQLAKELDLPYIVHDRESHEDVYKIMKEMHSGQTRGVVHCFSGSVEMAKELIKLNFLVSFGGPVTYKNAKVAKEVVREIPLNKILIETDSPYLPPDQCRGERNDCSNVRFAAEEIARLKGVTIEEVAKQTRQNFFELFGLK